MENLPKVLESKATIRFQDCDPFNHLNNAEYLNYLINAREDQLIDAYGIDIYDMASKEGKSWVVGSNQIAYLRPAFLMEKVTIDSQLLQYDDTNLLVELRMWNQKKTELKAILWSRFVHFDLLNQKKTQHSEKFLHLFESVVNTISETSFEGRILGLKKEIL